MKSLIYLCIVIVFQFPSYSQQQMLTAETLWKLGRINLEDVSPDGLLAVYSLTKYDISTNKSNTDLYTVRTDGAANPVKITNMEGHENNARFFQNGQKIMFLSNGIPFTCNADGSDQNKWADIEMNGFLISPKSDALVFLKDVKYRMTTQEKHPDLPLANARIYDDLMYRHWKSWDDQHDNNVFYAKILDGKMLGEAINIVNAAFQAPVDPMDGIEQVSISADSRYIAYSCKKLTGREYALSTNTDIFVYDVQTKSTKNVSESNKGYDKNPVFSPDGKKLIWNAMTTPGYEADKNQLVLYDLTSSSVKMIGADYDNDADNASFAPDGKSLFFISAKDACRQIFIQDLNSLQIRQITTGVHDYNSFVPTTKGLVASRNSMVQPAEIYFVNVNGTSKQITQVNTELWSTIKKPEVKQKWVNTTDGKKMLVWTILPPDFDPNKKYPTLLYCQGGPQSTVSQFFSYRWNFSLMASNGYVIVAPCRRGMPGFGQEWNLAISKDWGGQCMKDYLSAIDDASKESYVDKNKLGAIGASFGGYSVFYLAGNHQKRFKCFLSHCGVFNLESMYGTTEEMWFVNYDIGGPYWDKGNKKQYEKFSPHKFVENWDTPMMVIHGEKDFRVPVSEGMQAFQVARLKGLPSRLLLFPEEGHWIQSAQNGLLWQREFYSWLDKWLK
ncbi:MAG: S9 family peptidase [Saprospiraceae bacterium]|nr:S9 family peptidase [Saprospiraceae bacterium]MBK9630531.1 S9 family peptidase [Saprospiraceae bacterium]